MSSQYNTFQPNHYCKREEIVTFLHCAMGQPMVKTDNKPLFTDVSNPKDYYFPEAFQ